MTRIASTGTCLQHDPDNTCLLNTLRLRPISWETASYSNAWPWTSAFHRLSTDQTVCVTVGLSAAFRWPPCNTSAYGESKLRMKWPQHITYCSILSRGHAVYAHDTGERGGGENIYSITQRLEERAAELLGRRDCHVCINRHWFFCPALAPQPFILSFVVGAQRGWRNSVTVQSGPWGQCVRIDFTCKRGEGLEPLNKGRLCHQRAEWVKSHWMDNDTYCGKRGGGGGMRDRGGRGNRWKERELIDTVEEGRRFLKIGV